MTVTGRPEPVATVLVVDMANVVGSVPDGWWRDRVGAAERLLSGLVPLAGRTVTVPGGMTVGLCRIVAVLEGQANRAEAPIGGRAEPPAEDTSEAIEIVRAPASGDEAITSLVTGLVADGDHVLVVTADRGLRARLPAAATTTGPGWLNGLLGRG